MKKHHMDIEEADFIDILDLWWLSKFTTFNPITNKQDTSLKSDDDIPQNDNDEEIEDSISETSDEDEEQKEQDSTLDVHKNNQSTDNPNTTNHKSATAFQAPKKLSISNYREWEKAFRSISLKTLSKNKFQIDEEATAEWIAASGIYDIKFQRVKQNYFSITLIIDKSDTMELWEETIKLFEQMISTFGIFYKINTYYLDSSLQNAKLCSDSKLNQQISDKTLITEGKQNLIWILSDCLAPAWQSADMYKKVHFWSNYTLTTVIQMFPKRMWLGTTLYEGTFTQLESTNFSPPNHKLISEELCQSEQKDKCLKLPIVSFDPYALQRWAKVVTNKYKNSISGIILEEFSFDEELDDDVEPTAQDRIDRFYSQASPTAHKLAEYMSVLPVDFQVVRILQDEKVPDSDQSHVAEVFLGGLIKKNEKNGKINYEFYPQVREILNDNITPVQSMEILERMSNFLISHLGSNYSLSALINDPSGVFKGDIAVDDGSIAYAKIVSSVLKRAGGRFSDIADMIEDEIGDRYGKDGNLQKLTLATIEELSSLEDEDNLNTDNQNIVKAPHEINGNMTNTEVLQFIISKLEDSRLVWNSEKELFELIFYPIKYGAEERIKLVKAKKPILDLLKNHDKNHIRRFNVLVNNIICGDQENQYRQELLKFFQSELNISNKKIINLIQDIPCKDLSIKNYAKVFSLWKDMKISKIVSKKIKNNLENNFDFNSNLWNKSKIKIKQILQPRIENFIYKNLKENNISTQNKKIYISYSRKDYDFVMQLNDDLQQLGFDTWIDKSIIGRIPWKKNITDAIENSYALIWIVSPESIYSKDISTELSFADDKDIRIIPVMYKKAKILFPYHELSYIDFTDNYDKYILLNKLVDLKIPRIENTIQKHERENKFSTTKNKKIYISYNKKDIDFVMKMKEDLQDSGFEVWVDQKRISGGEVWRKSIANALEDSNAVVWVVSPDSVNSKYVNKELSFADGKDIRIIPVMYKKAEIPFPYHELSYIDFTDNYDKYILLNILVDLKIPRIENFIQKLKSKIKLFIDIK